jgi:hypothetical protein
VSTRPTDRELKAMTNLAPDPDFKLFVEYLTRSLAEETKTCIYSESPDARGRAQVLTELLVTVEEARENVKQRIAIRAVKPGANAF